VSHKISRPFCVPLQQASSSSFRFMLSLTTNFDFILEVLTTINMTLRSAAVWRIVVQTFQIKLLPETTSELS